MILVGVAYQAGALPIGAEAIEHAIRLNGVAAEANIAAFRQGRRSVSGAGARCRDAGTASGGPSSRWRQLLAVRAPELAAYQDPAYADDVRRSSSSACGRARRTSPAATVTCWPGRWPPTCSSWPPTRTSTRSPGSPSIPPSTRRIDEQFGRGARYAYRLHPPVLRVAGDASARSASARGSGRPSPPWWRCGGCAAPPFDPFGRTEVRRDERALLAEYRDVITRLADGLTAGNHALAVEIAGLPDMVRGYEHIKLGNVAEYRARMAELLAQFSPDGGSWSTASHSGSVR